MLLPHSRQQWFILSHICIVLAREEREFNLSFLKIIDRYLGCFQLLTVSYLGPMLYIAGDTKQFSKVVSSTYKSFGVPCPYQHSMLTCIRCIFLSFFVSFF
jgi:hypothetical protein